MGVRRLKLCLEPLSINFGALRWRCRAADLPRRTFLSSSILLSTLAPSSWGSFTHHDFFGTILIIWTFYCLCFTTKSFLQQNQQKKNTWNRKSEKKNRREKYQKKQLKFNRRFIKKLFKFLDSEVRRFKPFRDLSLLRCCVTPVARSSNWGEKIKIRPRSRSKPTAQ